jgi:DNA-binding transcriptional MerR regulator
MPVPRAPKPPPTLEALLDTLRREARQATRRPRAAIDAAVRELLKGTSRAPGERASRKQYRIDDLARAAGTTVRNARAYQERGLLHPPRRSGRVALFDESHLARLKLITSLLERGYNGAHIAEMLHTWETGGDLADILGLERLVRPWSPDEQTTMTMRQVRELAGDQASLNRLVANKLVELRGTRAIVRRPKLLHAFAELRGYGIPMDVVVDLHERVAPMLDDIGRVLVEAGTAQVADLMPNPAQLTDRSMTELVTMLIRFRTLAMDSVMATLAHAIEQRIEALLGDYLAHLAGAAPQTTSERAEGETLAQPTLS